MSGWEKFGRDRHKPDGKWVQFSLALSVTGVQHRKGAAMSFARDVRRAEAAGRPYGVRLVAEPDNAYDPNAIKVVGYCGDRQSAPGVHIGYVEAGVAKEVMDVLHANRLPFAGELYSIYKESGGFIDIKFIVLGPPGTGMKARSKPGFTPPAPVSAPGLPVPTQPLPTPPDNLARCPPIVAEEPPRSSPLSRLLSGIFHPGRKHRP